MALSSRIASIDFELVRDEPKRRAVLCDDARDQWIDELRVELGARAVLDLAYRRLPRSCPTVRPLLAHRGDFVFVFPNEPGAPREVRGLAGTVKKVRGDRAAVVWQNNETAFLFEVDAHMLRHERRRRERPPASWSTDELAAAG